MIFSNSLFLSIVNTTLLKPSRCFSVQVPTINGSAVSEHTACANFQYISFF